MIPWQPASRGVFFFDEFDAIGADRALDNEVGEMRRVLNSFLQFIENDSSDSIIIAATNSKRMLDQALFRRFDDVPHYELPTIKEAKALVKQRVQAYDPRFSATEKTAEMLVNLSQAYLEFRRPQGAEFITKSLEYRPSGIRLLNVRKSNGIDAATVYIPKTKEGHSSDSQVANCDSLRRTRPVVFRFSCHRNCPGSTLVV